MTLSPRSMAALWLSGFEDDPEQLQCGELCVFEIFGNALGPAGDAVGRGRRRASRPSATRRSPRTSPRPGSPIDVAELAHLRRRLGRRRGGLHRRRRRWYAAARARRRTRCS